MGGGGSRPIRGGGGGYEDRGNGGGGREPRTGPFVDWKQVEARWNNTPPLQRAGAVCAFYNGGAGCAETQARRGSRARGWSEGVGPIKSPHTN
jgi:hypothetical protein